MRKLPLALLFAWFVQPVLAAERLLSPSDNLAQAMVDANPGDVLVLSEGTYTATGSSYAPDGYFRIIKPITIRASGRQEATILQGSADYVVMIHAAEFRGVQNPSGARLEGVTLRGNGGGVFVKDYQNLVGGRLSDITLKNLVIELGNPSSGHGISVEQADQLLISDTLVTDAYANGIYFSDVSDAAVLRSEVRSTRTQHGIGVVNSRSVRLFGNEVTGSGFHAILLVQSTDSRVENNRLTGFTHDGITVTDGSHDNLVRANTIISPVRANGGTKGTGIWFNCSSNRNVAADNIASGSPENGISIFAASQNLIVGNKVSDNFEGGGFIWDTTSLCLQPAFPGETPVGNRIESNWIQGNLNNSMIIERGGKSSLLRFNFLSGINEATGTLAAPQVGGIQFERSESAEVIGNTLTDFAHGFLVFADALGVNVFHNAQLSTMLNYGLAPTLTYWSQGSQIGGNFWYGHLASGNPGSGPAFTDFVYDSVGRRGGGNSDSFPFSDNALGRPAAISVLEPFVGQQVARGGTRVLRWQSSGCTYVDIDAINEVTGVETNLGSNLPDIGRSQWTPGSLSSGSWTIRLRCKNALRTAAGAEDAVHGVRLYEGLLRLASHHEGERIKAGSNARVYWLASDTIAPREILLTDGSGQTRTLASGLSGEFADISIPADAVEPVWLTVRTTDGQYADSSDGTLRVASASTAVLDPKPGDILSANQRTLLKWRSPASSRFVQVHIVDAMGQSVPVVLNIADTGEYEWTVRPLGLADGRVRVSFFSAAGQELGSAESDRIAIGLSSGVGVDAESADCIFDWAEDSLAEFLSPARPASRNVANERVREYITTQSQMRFSAPDGRLYYVGPVSAGQRLDLGLLSFWRRELNCER
ncbi:MAG: right-handed parallel beta-helix repeat-containing protein [Gammaproteobacteria bacterium SHHR-1]